LAGFFFFFVVSRFHAFPVCCSVVGMISRWFRLPLLLVLCCKAYIF
jgi:hypothetical protein